MTALCELLTTDLTHVWSLAGVQAEVDHQITPLSKCLAAVVTAVRPLPGVDTNVSLQVTGLCELLTTDLTHVGSLAKVNTVVNHQTTLPSKCLPVDVTAVRPLPGVDTNVCLQVTGLCELLPTDLTNVRSLTKVNTVVAHQTTLLSKRLPTDVTAVWPLPGMRPTMVCQVMSMICGEFTPLALVPPVAARAVAALLHMSVQTILSQTCVVAMDTVNHFSTCQGNGYSVLSYGLASLVHHIIFYDTRMRANYYSELIKKAGITPTAAV